MKIKPLSVTRGMGISEHDSEGRLILAEFDTFYLINTYVPNSGLKLKEYMHSFHLLVFNLLLFFFSLSTHSFIVSEFHYSFCDSSSLLILLHWSFI